jgi:hypothetical protein
MHAQLPSYVPKDGLIGWWPANGTTEDVSGNENHADTVLGLRYDVDRYGRQGCFRLESGSRIVCSIRSRNSTQQGEDCTINVWVSQNPDQRWINRFIAGFPSYSFRGGAFALSIDSMQRLGVWGNGYGVSGGEALQSSDWYMVSAVLRDSLLQLFVNGEMVYSTEARFVTFESNFRIGSVISDEITGLLGRVDDVGLWSRALTAEEIARLYRSCPQVPIIRPDGQPADIRGFVPGSTVRFGVAVNFPECSFEWQLLRGDSWVSLTNAGPYSGVDTDTLVITYARGEYDGNLYRCVVRYIDCEVISGEARLTGACPTPFSSSGHPSDVDVNVGETARFAVDVVTTNTTFQWQRKQGLSWESLNNGGGYAGVNTSTLTVLSVTHDLSGTMYRCSVRDSNCSWVSDSAVLMTCGDIIEEPRDVLAKNGASALFTAKSTDGLVWYMWQVDEGLGFTECDSARFTVPSIGTLEVRRVDPSINNTRYRCIMVSQTCTADTTSSAVLRIDPSTNVDENLESMGAVLSVHPSPASSTLIIRSHAPVSTGWAIVDAQGAVVQTLPNVVRELVIDISTWPEGVYCLYGGNYSRVFIVGR